MSSQSRRIETSKSQRRARGAFFTPQAVVDYMVESTLTGHRTELVSAEHRPLRILDPACGDGAFLVGVARCLQEMNEPTPTHICGVDIHAESVELARSNTEQALRTGKNSARASLRVLVGDSLLGPGLDADSSISDSPNMSAGLNWQVAFPDAAADGGFDIILGNPPYRREKDAKPLFDQLATGPLGSWRQARMDLWYYFLHRGLDLLKPGGELCFIVNSYWAGSAGASQLINRLEAETTVREIVLLETMRVFPQVSGRHLILRVQKGRDSNARCRLITIPQQTPPLRSTVSFWQSVRTATEPGTYEDSDGQRFFVSGRSQADLFQQGRLQFGIRATELFATNGQSLGELFDVRQGIAENPPAITERLNRAHGNRFRTGEGVFVLTDEEVASLNLTDAETSLLRPYYSVGEIGRYRLPVSASRNLFYLNRQTAPSPDAIPQIAAHLAPFREILDRRRETARGICGWWQLHWPREERLFIKPRILSVQMGPRPQFVYAEQPTFVGFSVNVIVNRVDGGSPASSLSLPALTGILNSDFAASWFEDHAKRRGVRLEISGGLLRSFPLPQAAPEIEARLDKAVRERQQATSAPRHTEIEALIEQLVRNLYDCISLRLYLEAVSRPSPR